MRPGPFLFATTLTRIAPPDAVNERELDLLPAFQPVLLAARAAQGIEARRGLRIYWLQSVFPYSVQTVRPPLSGSATSQWNALVLRVEM